MVSVDKIEKGIAGYLDDELMSQFRGSSVERVVAGTAVSLMLRKTGTIIEGYRDNPTVKMLGIMDNDGNVDVDTIAEELKKNIGKDGMKVDVPIFGTMTFHKSDVDKLRDYINGTGGKL